MNANATHLPVFDTMKTAWLKVKGSKSAFFGVMLCYIIVKMFNMGVQQITIHTPDVSSGTLLLAAILFFVLGIISFLLQLSFIYLGVKRAVGEPIYFKMIKQLLSIELFFKAIGLLILLVVVFLPGVILVVLPVTLGLTGIAAFLFYSIGGFFIFYMTLRLSLAQASVVYKKINPWRAIKLSFQATQSNVLPLLGISILNGIIVAMSAIAFFIGLIWTVPYAWITYGEIYKKLIVSRTDLS